MSKPHRIGLVYLIIGSMFVILGFNTDFVAMAQVLLIIIGGELIIAGAVMMLIDSGQE